MSNSKQVVVATNVYSERGVLLFDMFSDAEQFNNLLDTNVWTDLDSDANHTSVVVSASSRLEQDGGTTAGSTCIRSARRFNTPTVFSASLTTTTLTPAGTGEVFPSLRLYSSPTEWVRWGPYKENGGEDSIGFIQFSDAGSIDQEVDVDNTNTDAVQREYAIAILHDKVRFYIDDALKYEMSFTGAANFYVDLVTSIDEAVCAYADIFWTGVRVSTWAAYRLRHADADSEDLEATVDEIPSETNAKTFNATALQSVQDEAEDALEGENLDHLLKTALPTSPATDIQADSALGEMMGSVDMTTYDRATDSLEAISDSVATGSLEIEADAGSTATTIIDAAALTQATDDWFKGAMLVSMNGTNVGQARPVVSFSSVADSVDVFPAFLAVPNAGDDFLLISSWRPHVLDQQPDVVVNTNANIAAVDIFDLNTAGVTFMVNTLRIKAADPGAQIITVTLKELINDVSVTVDTFTITNANFDTYFSLMDMFGLPHLSGDDIQVTIHASDDGNYVITGQYQYSQAYTA